MNMDNTAIDYEALEKERSYAIEGEIKDRLKQRSWGRSDGLSHVVLRLVTDENYEMAADQLQLYIESKRDYPNFQSRAPQYIRHCKDLINAIKTKRDFPGLTMMSLSKRQEIYDHVLGHFEELKSYLKYLERLERDYKLQDVRSTAWVLRAFMNCAMFVFLFAMFRELIGLGTSFEAVVDKIVTDLSQFVLDLFGF